jgi:hypothetical protein
LFSEATAFNPKAKAFNAKAKAFNAEATAFNPEAKAFNPSARADNLKAGAFAPPISRTVTGAGPKGCFLPNIPQGITLDLFDNLLFY